MVDWSTGRRIFAMSPESGCVRRRVGALQVDAIPCVVDECQPSALTQPLP
jgi:hypothetical protein